MERSTEVSHYDGESADTAAWELANDLRRYVEATELVESLQAQITLLQAHLTYAEVELEYAAVELGRSEDNAEAWGLDPRGGPGDILERALVAA
jgi:hypothetical protein